MMEIFAHTEYPILKRFFKKDMLFTVIPVYKTFKTKKNLKHYILMAV